MGGLAKARRWRWGVGVVLAYLALRVPFLWHPVLGEEGIFAEMLLTSPRGPDYGLMARVGGLAVRDGLSHPAGLYEMYTRLGAVLRAFGWQHLVAAVGADVSARTAQLLFQGVLWLAVAVRLRNTTGFRAPAWTWATAALLSAPMAVGAGVWVTPDTSAGVLLAGLVALAIEQTGRPSSWPWRVGPLAASAFALGALGKQEWSVSFLATMAAGLLWAFFVARRERAAGADNKREGVSFLALASVGVVSVIAGNVVSWHWDKANYVGGLHLILQFGRTHTVLFDAATPRFWLGVLVLRLPFVLTGVAACALLAERACAIEGRRRPTAVLGFLWPVALFLPFAASTWGNSYRYFAPSFAAAFLPVLSLLLQAPPGPKTSRVVVKGARALCVVHVGVLAGLLLTQRALVERPLTDLRGHQTAAQQTAARAVGKNCVPRLPAGYAYSRGIDFVGDSIAPSDAQALLDKHGRSLCP